MARAIRNLMIRLGLDVDPSGMSRLTRGLDKAGKRVTDFSGKMDKLRTPAMVTGLVAASGAATSFAAAIAPAAAAAGVAMPAAMVQTKLAAGTLKIALLGVGDAMTAVADGDAKKLEEAMKNLSPNAKAFVRESAGFYKAFTPVRKAVQDQLFAGLGKQIDPVAKNLMPAAQRGMLGISGAFNKGAKEAIGFAKTDFAKGALNTVFTNTTGILNNASTAVRPLLGLITNLVLLGQPLAKRMADWAINGIKAAAAFVQSERGAEFLRGKVKAAGDILATLGRITGNLAVGLGNFFNQSGKQSSDFLGTIEKLTAKFAAWSQTAQGQQQVASAFKLLGDVARQLLSVLPLLIGPLGGIMKLITSLPPGVQGTVTKLLAFAVVAGSLGGKLTSLASVGFKATSAIVQFGGGLIKGSAGLASNATMASRAGAAMRSFGSAMGSGVAAGAAMIGNLSRMAGMWLLNTTRTIASTVAQKAAAVASKAMAVATWLVNAAMRANPIGLIITLIIGLVAIIVLAYKKNETFRKIVQAVWKGIQAAISFAVNNIIKPVIQWLYNFIVNVLGPKFMWFHNSVVRPVMNKIGDIIRVVIAKVKEHFMFMHRLVTQTIPNAFRTGVAAIGVFWNKLKEIAKKPVAFVVNTVYNAGIARVWNWIADKTGLSRIPTISGFARGGILPGFSRKDDQIIAARSGEGILVPEAVKALGAGFINQTNAAARNGGPRNVAKVLGIAGDPGGLGIPGYQDGGIVGWVKGFFAKAKNYFVEGLIKAVKGVTDPLLRLSQNTIAKNGFGSMIHAAVSRIVNSVLEKLKSYETELGGGGGMGAVRAARSQIGVPYSWGGGGPGGPSYGIAQGANIRGFDCSGLTEYAWYKATKRSIGGTTYAQKGFLKPISGPRPGAVGQPHPGHTYLATEKNTIVEAPYTGARVREVGMRNTPYWGWPPFNFDNGGVWQPGTVGYNGLRKPEYVFNEKQIQGMGGDIINITINAGVGTDSRALENAVYEALKSYKRRNGRKLNV